MFKIGVYKNKLAIMTEETYVDSDGNDVNKMIIFTEDGEYLINNYDSEFISFPDSLQAKLYSSLFSSIFNEFNHLDYVKEEKNKIIKKQDDLLFF